jgi:hypothetical protein
MNNNTETVTFNVGGQKYEISRSQFDKYPDSMLAKTVSDRWLEDPSQEIFIDRDGSLFRHVLSFIRDGKVFLWHGITREEFIKELEYFGIECDDNISEYIHEKPSISITSDPPPASTDLDTVNTANEYVPPNNQNIHEKRLLSINDIGGYVQGLQNQNHYNDIAIYCMKAYYFEMTEIVD